MRRTWGVWRDYITAIAGSTALTVESERVPEGEAWYVERVCIRKSGGVGATCQVSIIAPQHVHDITTKAISSDDVNYDVEVRAWLVDGERLAFRFTTITASTQVWCYITGEKRGMYEP